MDLLLAEMNAGLPDWPETFRIVLRVTVAAILGGIVGYERERTGKAAGLRTHMLVSLGSAVFVLAVVEGGGNAGDVSRVIQGVASGIGFLGAGAILKLSDTRQIKGLTTAAGIWMTAAIGLAAGLGRYGLAALAVVLAWAILAVVARLEVSDSTNDRA